MNKTSHEHLNIKQNQVLKMSTSSMNQTESGFFPF